MDNKATVATPSPRVEYLESKRKMVRAVMKGTEGLRGHEEYLPRHPAESDGVYKQRKERAFLDNFVELAIDKVVGKLFSKEIQVSDVPTEIETILENIDRQGRGLNPFAMDVAKCAFRDGISFVMVDMQPADGVRTLAEEKALGIRPYAIHVKPENVLETLSEMVAGVETLTRVRVLESVSVPDEGWGYEEFEQVRVWIREHIDGVPVVRWELYRQEGNKKEWVLFAQGLTTFKAIHLFPFYTNRVGFMAGLPPFQNIAESTIEHWQWKSEHAHALSMCCFGMYTAVGVPDDFEFQVGPAKVHRATDPDAKFSVLETSGVGVTLTETTLKEIESRIETAGVRLRVEDCGKVTATAAAIDSEDTNAGLKAIAGGFSDSIEKMLQAFADIMGIDNAGEVEVNSDFGTKKGSDAGLQELAKLRALGDISRQAIIAEYVRRGELSEDFDADSNDEELSAEGTPLALMTNQQRPQ